jgi:peptidoglycan/LPS O-acetylase OafA/YrhL
MDKIFYILLIGSFITALLTTFFLSKKFEINVQKNRNSALDGMRGYLAFSVFCHHSLVWYFYIQKKIWSITTSNLYFHLGSSSVAFFFMISGFIFFSKIIKKEKNINWVEFYISRILRMYPLYLVILIIIFIIIGVLTNWEIKVDFLTLVLSIFDLLKFETPEINKFKSFYILGVTWSLKYELCFYLMLPSIALILKKNKPSIFLIIISILTIILVILDKKYNLIIMSCFLVGFFAKILSFNKKFTSFSKKKITSFFVIFCIGILFINYSDTYRKIPLILLSTSFVCIACGNDMFGILKNRISIILGQISYSIYLIHPILLFISFNFIIKIDDAKILTPIQYSVIILVLVPILIITSFFSYKFLEVPGMNSKKKILDWIKKI